MTYYAWAGGEVISEYTELASQPNVVKWAKSYISAGGRLVSTASLNGTSETIEHHHADRLGTRIVTNPTTGGYFEQETLPFGSALNAESSGATNRRFTSYDRSNITGLDYAVNRHYDSGQSRFTQVDPIGMAASLANPQSFIELPSEIIALAKKLSKFKHESIELTLRGQCPECKDI